MSELAKALSKAQSKMSAAQKDAKNPHFKSSYATLASTWEALRGPLTENGLSVVQFGDLQGDHQVLTTRLLHASGEFVESHIKLINQKGDMQGLGSAWSYARRYGLQAIAGIAQDDDDGQAASVARPQMLAAKEEVPWPDEPHAPEAPFNPAQAWEQSKTGKAKSGVEIHFGFNKGKTPAELTDKELTDLVTYMNLPPKVNPKTGKAYAPKQVDLDLLASLYAEQELRKNTPTIDQSEEIPF